MTGHEVEEEGDSGVVTEVTDIHALLKTGFQVNRSSDCDLGLQEVYP